MSLTRKDKCALVGKRALRLRPHEKSRAWYELARLLIADLGDFERCRTPKFNDILRAIRLATIHAAKGTK